MIQSCLICIIGQTTAIILNETKNNPVATLVDHLLKAVVKIYKC
jgi:hypothetical protein